MRKTHVNFQFDKDFGGFEKGDNKALKKTFALRLQNQRKVGKIKKAEKAKAEPKAVKPEATKPTGPKNVK